MTQIQVVVATRIPIFLLLAGLGGLLLSAAVAAQTGADKAVPNTVLSLESSDGQVIEAEVTAIATDKVSVKRADGQSFDIPLARLSPATIQRLSELKASNPALSAAPAASGLPEALKNAAAQAFSKGATYYIWLDDDAPAEYEPSGGLLLVSVNYVARGKPVPFGTSFQLLVKQGDNFAKLTQQLTPQELAVGAQQGKAPIMFIVEPQHQYSGEGTATLFLIDPTSKKQISNQVKVQAKFK